VTAPAGAIAGCRQAHRALLGTIDGLTDEQARSASKLAGWTIGHVLTHIARNADSVVRRLEGAAQGRVVGQYPGGYGGRAAAIEVGAERPAAELVADVRSSAAELEAAIERFPATAWDGLTRDVSGAELPAHTTVLSRWREVEVHHVDLGLGDTPADWPPELVALWLPVELGRLAHRADPTQLLARTIGRGPAPEPEPW
jgi:maleylpyruvate isomerase